MMANKSEKLFHLKQGKDFQKFQEQNRFGDQKTKPYNLKDRISMNQYSCMKCDKYFNSHIVNPNRPEPVPRKHRLLLIACHF